MVLCRGLNVRVIHLLFCLSCLFLCQVSPSLCVIVCEMFFYVFVSVRKLGSACSLCPSTDLSGFLFGVFMNGSDRRLTSLHSDQLLLFLAGAHFTRHQHSHATSCRHFHLGAPQAPISAEFPLGHASQPPQTGLATHLPPAHHPPLTALPAPPQFQDVPGPPFLPQALHQQYLIQQQLLEAQQRRILPHSR